MVRRLVAVTATAAALAIAVAGCGSSDSGSGTGSSSGAAATTSAGGSSGGDAVAWAEKVCGAIGPQVASLSKGPDVDPTDPAKAKDSMVTYLGTLEEALSNMVTGIKDAGDPPVADGASIASKAASSLDEAKTAVATAKTNLSKVDATDPAAFQAGFLQVSQDLQKLSAMEDPTKGLRGNSELNGAFAQAPSCKALDGAGASATATASTAPTS